MLFAPNVFLAVLVLFAVGGGTVPTKISDALVFKCVINYVPLLGAFPNMLFAVVNSCSR